MAFLDADDLRLLTENVDRFTSNFVNDTRTNEGEAWKDAAALGWLGVNVGFDHGGIEGGAVALAAVMRGIGRALLGLPYVSTAIIGAGLIERTGNAAQKADLLPRLIDGDLMIALADREPNGGHDRHWIQTTATLTPGGYRLNGAKEFVLDAPLADRFIVTAKMDGGGDGIVLFIVDPAMPGIESTVYRAIDGRPVADLRFKDAVVDSSALLQGAAEPALDAVYALATLSICAEACGIAAALNAHTLEYLKTRRQFGVTLGSFQVLQHRMADMYVDEQQMAAITARAIEQFDAGAEDAVRWISAAKFISATAGRRIAEASIQLHGGMGLTDELIIGHYLKRILMIATQFGDGNWHLDQLDAGRSENPAFDMQATHLVGWTGESTASTQGANAVHSYG